MFQLSKRKHLDVVLLLLVVSLISLTLGQSSNSSCTAKKSCGECIRSPDCVWCSQPVSSSLICFVWFLMLYKYTRLIWMNKWTNIMLDVHKGENECWTLINCFLVLCTQTEIWAFSKKSLSTMQHCNKAPGFSNWNSMSRWIFD
jgi:hypothetical protein